MSRILCWVLVLGGVTGCGPEDGTRPLPTEEAPGSRPRFDGEAALELIEEQVAFGPRIPGTEGHSAQLAWMTDLLSAWADELRVQAFSFTTSQDDQLQLANLLARFQPDSTNRILLLAHWDTRPRSDQALDSDEREKPVPGANDGGSGTAVLLHLARLMSETAPPLGVDLLFVDGEDYGPGIQDMFIGSRYFASTMPQPPPWRYGFLLDMVGDKDPRFPIEGYSAAYAPALCQKIWGVAEDLGFGSYFPGIVGTRILDDHVPLNEAGLQTVNLIDFEYGPGNSFWHTPQDTPENVSAETLRMVGEVVTELVYRGG